MESKQLSMCVSQADCNSGDKQVPERQISIVGYAAAPSEMWEGLRNDAVEGITTDLVFGFCGNPKEAVVRCKKQSVKKLGTTLSQTTPPCKSILRKVGWDTRFTLEHGNFYVFRLSTSVNVAEALSQQELTYEDGVYRVSCNFFDSGFVGVFSEPEEWKLEIMCFG